MSDAFASFDALADHIDRIARNEERADRYGRRIVAQRLRLDIQNRLGKAELLPPPLAESTQRERLRLGYSADETLYRTGALRRSIEEADIAPRETGVGSDSKIAPFHEFGGTVAGHPPKRSFFASTFREGNLKYFHQYVSGFFRALGIRF